MYPWSTSFTMSVCPHVKTPDWTCVYEICNQVLVKFLNTFKSQISTKNNGYIAVGKLITWTIMPLDKIMVAQIFKKIAAFHKTQRFIIYATTFQWSLCSARWIQSAASHLLSLRFILILSSPSIPSTSEWFLSFRDSYQNFTCISFLSICATWSTHIFSLIWSL